LLEFLRFWLEFSEMLLEFPKIFLEFPENFKLSTVQNSIANNMGIHCIITLSYSFSG